MTILTQIPTKKSSFVYAVFLFLYPFSVLFCPPLNFGFFYARIDELLILMCVPMLLADLKAQTGFFGNQRDKLTYSAAYRRSLVNIPKYGDKLSAKKLTSIEQKTNYAYKSFSRKLMMPYMILFLLFCWGIAWGFVWGYSFGNLTTSYLRQISRPLFLVLIAFVMKSIMIRAKMDKKLVLISILTSLCLAGLLGYYAMYNPEVSIKLVRLYNPDLEFRKYFQYTFDMSIRAMSVFYGYDQASVTYGFGCILAMAWFINTRKNNIYKLFSVGSIVILFVSIISSARIGVLSVLVGGLVILLLPSWKRLNSTLLLMFIVLAFVASFSQIANLFPNSETFKRFDDVLGIFNYQGTIPLIERSEGLAAVVNSQILAQIYPKGVDMVFGYGDDTRFVSDIGYVSIFIKYGLAGLLVVIYVYFRWISSGVRMINYGLRNKISSERWIAHFILPGIAVLFLLAAMKGSLYFISPKTGDIVSIILGLALFETQSILNRENEK